MPALPVGATTALVITGVDIPPYSARDLTQTLEPIAQASALKRTINGVLEAVNDPAFFKYKSTISGDDQQPPAFNGIWPGMVVTVECVYELAYLTAGGSPDRHVVTGSSRTDGAFTFYRPELEMMVVNTSGSYREWTMGRSWSIDLEEV